MQATTKNPRLYCTFCRKDRKHVAQLVAGPGVHICDACIAVCGRLLTGKPTATFGAWDSLTDDEFLATLPASAAALDAADATLREHVALLRERGIPWERIASVLGVSRQAVWARFSSES
ncbi:MAG TPA: ClpX C4-type zinc finger protein [Polyangiaceae bacterium]|jgi:DNA-directed RNA polymerase specialized sigma24 family protein